MIKILIIDRDIAAITNIREGWRNYDYECRVEASTKQGIKTFLSFTPDIVVTEYKQTDISVQVLAKRLHKLTSVPIVVFSNRNDEAAVLKALAAGAEDFIKKSNCSSSELFLRLSRILYNFRSRQLVRSNNIFSENFIQIDNINIHLKSCVIKKNNTLIFLPAIEYKLLLLLAANKNNVVSINDIISSLFSDKDPILVKKTIYTYFSNIRKKLDLTADSNVSIKCITNIGYCLVVK